MSTASDTDARPADGDAIRSGLAQRINRSAHPSLLINDLHAASARSEMAAKQLTRLLERAPRIPWMIRSALRDAFGVDPDTLLLKVPAQLEGVPQSRELVEASLAVLAGQGTDDGPLACTRDCVSYEALGKVLGDDWPARIDAANAGYWKGLAPESWRSRRDRWRELYAHWFADQALLAEGVGELSERGLAMVHGIAEAPTRQARSQAGGFWNDLRVSPLFWPGSHSVPLAGALLISRVGDPRQVVFLPGLERVFHEFDAVGPLQERLPELLRGHVAQLWQRLPLRRRHVLDADQAALTLVAPLPLLSDALHHSADSLIDNQWQNERDCVLQINLAWLYPRDATRGAHGPALERIQALERERRRWHRRRPLLPMALEYLRDWDQQRCQRRIAFASLAPDLAINIREAKVRRHEQAILALLDAQHLDLDSAAYGEFVALHEQWLAQRAAASAVMDGHAHRLWDVTFWTHKAVGQLSRAGQLLQAREQALASEAQLQYRLTLLSARQLQLVQEVLGQPLASARGLSDTRVLGVALASGQRLAGALVITTAQALEQPSREQPALLYVPGSRGGLQGFDSLAAVSAGLDASLKSMEGPGIWQAIPRLERPQALTHIQALAVDESISVVYTVIEGHALKEAIPAQVRGFNVLEQRVAAGEAVFSELADPALARVLLADEAVDCLQVPPSDARVHALANLQVLRLAAADARQSPAWLAQATTVQRRRYRRLKTQTLNARHALEEGLLAQLPALEAFARDALTARLKSTGLHPAVDIDRPLLDVPDDVSTHWEGHPQRPVGESGIKTVVSQARTQFSLLQLALHGLDSDAPWAMQRLRHARYLDATWKNTLTPDYLLKMIAELDLGGRYQRLIARTFYGESGESTGLRPVLLRAFRLGLQLDLFTAIGAGLSEAGQRLFNVALSAKSAADLQRDGHQVQLRCVRLEGLTLPHPRHIAGVVVIVDQASGRCLVYWPQATTHQALTEYHDVATAQQALIDLAQVPELALNVAPGWESQALASYPDGLSRQGERINWAAVWEAWRNWSLAGFAQDLHAWFSSWRALPAKQLVEIEAEINEQRAQAPRGWLGITLTDSHDLLALLAHSRVLAVQRQARSESNSQEELQAYRAWRLGEQADVRVRGLLSFVPGIGLGVKLYEVLLAARQVHQQATRHSLFELVVSVHQALFEMALTLSPVASARLGRGAGQLLARQALGQLHRQQWRVAGGRFYMRNVAPGRPLKGLDDYRLPSLLDNAVPLRGRNEGTYARAGEQRVANGVETYAVYRRPGEDALRLKNPLTPGENELVLHIQEPRQWLLGADAPAPQPGPSTARWRPWGNTAPGTGWAPPTPMAQATHTRAVLGTQGWQAWGQALSPDVTQEFSASRRLYRVSGDRPYDALQLGNKYYEVLPGGLNAPDDVVFVTRSRPLAQNAHDDMSRWLAGDRSTQPIPFTHGADGLWTPRQPLFDRPLTQALGAAFPGLTQASRRFAAQRLVELADTSRSMTATRLLNIRATLDDWLPPAPGIAGQTDDLLRMLRPVTPTSRTSIYLGFDGVSPGFERVDFLVPFTLDASLRTPGAVIAPMAKPYAMQRAVEQVLVRQGFIVEKTHKSNSIKLHNLVATHPKSSNVYFFLTRWTDSPSVQMRSGSGMQLSDAWFQAGSRAQWSGQRSAMSRVTTALAQGRLVKVLAGIQHDANSRTFTVYFVRLTGI
ncbi:hypothetical protein HX871_05010 [Pseudomonas reactans]|uniref:Dermonecrotic toxin N-terminal domain-containing protein n=1 Tax=Pseudomonas reactans TaxID=117680 RepID=A0ABX2QPM7_9PSED|nr:DUF6543 domain-containing protein [Pseudomonas reactans]NWA46090.1 hypothetical protein [Pseudomonas reactans]NWD93764.1 hypothetical protein [Pseudomonas reactans]